MTDRLIREWNGISIPRPGVYDLDEAHKRIGFNAQHMMVSQVRGEFATASATVRIGSDPLDSAVRATIAAGSINTHNADRDAHLSGPDFLDVSTFPDIVFRSTGVRWPGGNDAIFYWAQLRSSKLSRRHSADPAPRTVGRSVARFVFGGELTVRDVTRPVDLTVEFGGSRRDPYGRDMFGFSATAEVDREAFGLVWNVALESGGVLVGKKVHIEIAGEAILRA